MSAGSESIPIRASRILLIILLCSHALAVVALMLADVHWMLRTSLTFAVLLHAVYSHHRYYALQHPDSVVQVMRGSDGWSLLLAGGSRIDAALGPVLITSFLTLLNFKSTSGGKKYAVLIFPDATDQHLIRQLGGGLRYGFEESESRAE